MQIGDFNLLFALGTAMYYSKDKDINAYVKRLLKHKSFRIISGKKHDQLCIFGQRKLAIPSLRVNREAILNLKILLSAF